MTNINHLSAGNYPEAKKPAIEAGMVSFRVKLHGALSASDQSARSFESYQEALGHYENLATQTSGSGDIVMSAINDKNESRTIHQAYREDTDGSWSTPNLSDGTINKISTRELTGKEFSEVEWGPDQIHALKGYVAWLAEEFIYQYGDVGFGSSDTKKGPEAFAKGLEERLRLDLRLDLSEWLNEDANTASVDLNGIIAAVVAAESA